MLLRSKLNSGIVHLLVLIIPVVLAVIVGGFALSRNTKTDNNIESVTPSPEATLESGNTSTPTSTSKATTSPTKKSTSTPKASPKATATSSNSGSSNSYNLSVATGAVKVAVKASSGVVVGDQLVEIMAQSGSKVLVNKSSDKDTQVARQGSNTVTFSAVPPGPYTVRAQYKGQWTGNYNVNVSSGQEAYVEIVVVGDTPTAAPTPTPKPKPECFNPVIYPSSTGTAPYDVLLQPGGSAGSSGGMVGYQWDYTGDGSWDTEVSPNAINYTYQTAGTYNVKMRVLGSNGEYSNTCQTTLTVN